MSHSNSKKIFKSIIRANHFNEVLVCILYIALCALLGTLLNLDSYISKFNFSFMNAVRHLNTISSEHDNIDASFFSGCFIYFLSYVLSKKIILAGLSTKKLTRKLFLSDKETLLINALSSYSKSLHLKYVPELYISPVKAPNALASGYTNKNSFIVITKGLMTLLEPNELKAILALQVSHIKLKNIKLTLAVSVASNGCIVAFDALFYKMLYKNKTNHQNNYILNKLFYLLKTLRFLLPVLTFLYRYILSSNRVNSGNKMAVESLISKKDLESALLKIKNYHINNKDLVSREYQSLPYNEARREMFVFDPSDFNYSQTIATPFKVQPDIDEQIETMTLMEKGEFSFL